MNMALHNGLENNLNLTKLSLRLGLKSFFNNPVVLNVLSNKKIYIHTYIHVSINKVSQHSKLTSTIVLQRPETAAPSTSSGGLPWCSTQGTASLWWEPRSPAAACATPSRSPPGSCGCRWWARSHSPPGSSCPASCTRTKDGFRCWTLPGHLFTCLSFSLEVWLLFCLGILLCYHWADQRRNNSKKLWIQLPKSSEF